MFEEGRIDIIKLGGEGAKSSGVGQSVVTNVAIVSDQLVIDGANLDGVTKVRITGPSGFDQTFAIESQSGSNLVANGLSNIAFAVGSVFDLILTDAQGAATHQVTFTLQDGAVTSSKLDDMGAGVGQVLKYDGTNWGPSDLGALTYAGTWDASSATAPNVSPSAGEYYIVSVAGTGIDLSDGSGSRNFAVGDWLVYNNTTSRWDKIDNATSVTSFNGRNGPISPATNDYTWAQIDKTTSPIGDLSNVNTTGAGVGSVLKFDGTNWIVGTDNTVSAGSVDSSAITDGSIVDADVNASAAIAQSKINNLTTDLASKLNLSGGTMTGDLTMGSNNIITSGTVDGVDVSALNTTVGNNSTAIAGKQNTITTGSTAQYLRGDLSLSTFATDARSAAVLNSTAGTETDQAASVAAMKTYVSSQVSGSGSVLDGGNTTGATVVVGTNDTQSLQLETNNTPAMTILNGGNVGIGTTAPSAILEIQKDGVSPEIRVTGIGPNSFDRGILSLSKANGTQASPTATVNNDRLGSIFFRGHNGTSNTTSAATIESRATENHSATNEGADLRFSTTPNSTTTLIERMRINENGNVGIGTNNPNTKLDVEGKITVGPIDATAGNTGAIALEELAANGTNSVTFRAPDSLAANYILTMPADDGDNGEVLTTDGSGVLSWAAAPAATSVSASAGSAATPSMSFSSDPNTGLFSGGADVIGFSVGGSTIFNASSSGLVSPTTGGGSVSTANGTASAPTFSFAGDTDTGWFRPAANTLAAATAGSERVRIDASGNVGIGTTNPDEELTVSGAGIVRAKIVSSDDQAGVTLSSDNTGDVVLFSPDTTDDFRVYAGGADRFSVTSAGNVGIGTISPSQKLSVVGGIQTIRTNTQEMRWNGGAGNQWRVISSINGATNGYLRFQNTTDNFTSNFTNALTIEEDGDAYFGLGNVGIGTTSPQSKLHVLGNGTTLPTIDAQTDLIVSRTDSSGSGPQMSILSGNAGTGSIYFGDTDDEDVGQILYAHSNNHMRFVTNASEAMRIDSAGNVGIGTTIPTKMLHLSKATGNTELRTQIGANYADFGTGAGSHYVFGYGGLPLRLGTVGSERMRIDTSGNVGIGTTTPERELHVMGDIRTAGAVSYFGRHVDTGNPSRLVIQRSRGTYDSPTALTDGDGIGDISFSGYRNGSYQAPGNSSGARIAAEVDGTPSGDSLPTTLIFRTTASGDTTNSERMRIAPNGNVGIGTTSPGSELHVNGSIFAGTTYDADPANNNAVGTFISPFGRISINRSSNPPLAIGRTNDGNILNFRSGGTAIGNISVSGSTVTYGAFTGVHYGHTQEDLKLGELISLGDNPRFPNKRDYGVNEPLYELLRSQERNSKKVFGAYIGLLESEKPFDDIDNPHNFMALGNGEVLVVDNGQDLEIGDYLISSDVPGYAELDPGEFKVAHIIARVTEKVDWDEINETHQGRRVKKVSVTFESFDKVASDQNAQRDRKIASLEEENREIKAENQEIKLELEQIKSKSEVEKQIMQKQLEDITSLVCALKPNADLCNK